MDPRVNVKLIGASVMFILCIVGALLFFVHKNKYEQCSEVYQVHFAQPITGLRKGDTIVYNGINAGRVMGMKPNFKTLKGAIVTICLDKAYILKSDAFAIIEPKSITGGLLIHIYPGSIEADMLKREKGIIPSIPGRSSRMEQMLESMPKILASLEQTIKKIEALFSAESVDSIGKTFQSVEIIADKLKKSIQKNEATINIMFSEVPLKFAQFLDKGNSIFNQLEKTLNSIEKSPRRFLYQDASQGVKLP
ncbi:MAG: MCE family protein [Alphaproteobacteria bacterium]|nr:MAG: MCE family protein [Alphaproteobacteria bacterium]